MEYTKRMLRRMVVRMRMVRGFFFLVDIFFGKVSMFIVFFFSLGGDTYFF